MRRFPSVGFATEGDGKGAADLVENVVVDGTELLRQPTLPDGVQSIAVDDGRDVHACTDVQGNLDREAAGLCGHLGDGHVRPHVDDLVAGDDEYRTWLAADLRQPHLAAPHGSHQASASSQAVSWVSGLAR